MDTPASTLTTDLIGLVVLPLNLLPQHHLLQGRAFRPHSAQSSITLLQVTELLYLDDVVSSDSDNRYKVLSAEEGWLVGDFGKGDIDFRVGEH